MPQNPQDSTNPGLVNVVDQGDGPLVVDECVTVSPSYNPASASASDSRIGGRTVTSTNPGSANVADEAFGRGLPRNVNVA